MITELVVLSPFIMGWYLNIIPIYVVIAILFVYYWLPKIVVLDMIMEPHFYKILVRVKSRDNKIALTFDDMPYGNHKDIINLLNTYNMKGTFFMISDYLTSENEQVFIDAVKQGHQLANHGATNSMHAIKKEENLYKEIDACHKAIVDIYNKANVPLPNNMFYRPGCGIFNKYMMNINNKYSNYRTALGSVYPNDPIMISPTINYYYLKYHIENGDIVILHDRKWTPKLLQKLLPWLINKGLDSITLDSLVRTINHD